MIRGDEAAQLARVILELRRRRTDHLPQDLFGEAAWGLLLAMFIADTEGTRLSAWTLFDRSGTSRAQGRRWMAVIMELGLAVSDGPCDGQNVVSLTARGISAVEACMADAQELMGTKPPLAET